MKYFRSGSQIEKDNYFLIQMCTYLDNQVKYIYISNG